MDTEQERRLNDLLIRAVEKPTAERRRYLEEECTFGPDQDPRLRAGEDGGRDPGRDLDLEPGVLEKDPDLRGDAAAAVRVLMPVAADDASGVKLATAPPAVAQGPALRPIKPEKTAASRPLPRLRSGGRPS